MFSINYQRNHAWQLLGLTLATIVLTTLIVHPVHSVTQQHAAGTLGPQGQTKRRRVQPMTQRQLARVGQNNKATSYSTRTQTPALNASSKIAFNRYTGEVTAIFTMNTDGSDVKQITDNQYYSVDPAWSPDGTKIAFDTSRNNGDSEIYLMDADGSNQAGFNPPAFGIDPAWSPDGKKIAYWRDYVGIIYVMNADGSNQKPLTNGDAFDLEPSWSPDGSKIVFSSYRDGQTEIYVMNSDGSNQTRLTNDVVNYDEEPVWSPDGSRIAFTKYLGCIDFGAGIFCDGAQIMLMQPDGSNPTYLTGGNNVAWSSFSTWSPDSTQLAFESYIVGEVYAIRADGSGLVDLTNNDADDFFPSWGPQPSTSPSCLNPIDCAEFFVRQHYHDFLNREPDAEGLAFWTNEIASCGSDQQCIEIKRINDSAAFYLSIEFQQTGYLVYRFYKASYGNVPGAPVPIRLGEFLPDTKEIGQGVIVNQAGWETVLETNRQAFAAEFVQRPRFSSAYPTSITPAEFVDTLFTNAGVTPSESDRTATIDEFGSAMTSGDAAARARALRRVAENSMLQQQEFNRAFVLMQYFGYLRRNPNDAPDSNYSGYDFWLNKLDSFNGNYLNAEMVKAFILSDEYRHRFGP
jgi:Tol biopolymer transport system component